MRIALVYAHFNVTGSLSQGHVHLARYLVDAGHEVHAYSLAADADRELVPAVVFHEVPARGDPGARRGLALQVATFARNATQMIRRDRAAYDVVHGRGMSTLEQDVVHITGVVDGEIRRERAAREAWRPREAIRDVLLPLVAPIVVVRRVMERRILRGEPPYEIHAASRQVRDDLAAVHGVDPARVRVVVPAVDLETFAPAADGGAVARRELGISPDEPVLLFCGHSFHRKGLDRAIRAVARMESEARLLVVGGDDPAPFAALARRLGVGGRVDFRGAHTDTSRFFHAADAFVLPSRVEMWGMTVGEAMAAGVPPVVSAAVGAAELVTDGRDGFVLPAPTDVGLLASTLDRLVAEPELARRLAASAYERARTLGWETHGRQVEEAMEQVVRRGTAASR